MKIKLLHHGEEWLPGDFEPPPPRRGKPPTFLSAWHHAVDAQRGVQLVKFENGTGVWNLDGKLLHHASRIGDASFSDDGILCLENVFGPCTSGDGIHHVITRRSLDTFEVRAEGEVCVPMGGVEHLVIDPTSGACLATWLDQEEWGYVGFDLATMKQLPWALSWQTPTLSPPAFAPGGRTVVACHTYSNYWWTDDPESEPVESPGGLRKAGDITVHDVTTNVITTHEAFIDVPKGWQPDIPDDISAWMCIWGPEFLDAEHFRIWWPDDSSDVLSLPLPPRIELSRPFGTTRNRLPNP